MNEYGISTHMVYPLLHRANFLAHCFPKDIDINQCGIEIDVRDNGSEIMIAHDFGEINEKQILLSDLLDSYVVRYKYIPYIALNIKSCGLASEIKNIKPI